MATFTSMTNLPATVDFGRSGYNVPSGSGSGSGNSGDNGGDKK